ncbi:MAG TPA: flagellar export protein FliJ [Gammaproteobacteria bacterium]|nr:flagellar export protein FliJ [Gammaproteobacteria bacterium]
MTRTQRIKRIVDLADVTRREASQQIASTRQAHEENLARLEQFRRYRAEYAQSLGVGEPGMSAARARELRLFIEQLERTIEALGRQTERSERQCGDAIGRWQQAARRSDALGEILDRSASDAARLADGRDQREIDDRHRCRDDEG